MLYKTKGGKYRPYYFLAIKRNFIVNFLAEVIKKGHSLGVLFLLL